MSVPICPRKDSEQGIILRGIKCQTAPSSHVRKMNSRLGILIILPSQYIYIYIYIYIYCYGEREREREREREKRERVIREKQLRKWTQDNPESPSYTNKKMPKLKIEFISKEIGHTGGVWKQAQTKSSSSKTWNWKRGIENKGKS